MKLQEVVKSILEQIEAETDFATHLNGVANCPQEVDLLAYFENRLAAKSEAQIYQHISSCNHCIEFLAMFAQISEETQESESHPPFAATQQPDPSVEKMAADVLEMIEQDELKFNKSLA
jgi:hypothetical protein